MANGTTAYPHDGKIEQVIIERALIVSGWLCSFYFNLVLHAAGGEKDLPEMSFTGGWVDDVIVPIFKFVGVTVLCMLPLIIYAIVKGIGFFNVFSSDDAVVYGLIALGTLAFPMIMLMAAVGGLGTLMHPILILLTLAKTIVPYLITCFLVGGALFATSLAADALNAHQGGKNPFSAQILISIASMYAWIVSMRVIGLYYHHFKHRFSWSWG